MRPEYEGNNFLRKVGASLPDCVMSSEASSYFFTEYGGSELQRNIVRTHICQIRERVRKKVHPSSQKTEAIVPLGTLLHTDKISRRLQE
jgi:hypothetical protein